MGGGIRDSYALACLLIGMAEAVPYKIGRILRGREVFYWKGYLFDLEHQGSINVVPWGCGHQFLNRVD
jgi:hypothetical protein